MENFLAIFHGSKSAPEKKEHVRARGTSYRERALLRFLRVVALKNKREREKGREAEREGKRRARQVARGAKQS